MLSWLQAAVDHDRQALAEIRQLERELDRLLDEHGTTLRDEPGIGTIDAATLVAEVGDPHRFASESMFARWCGTGAVALSSGEGSAARVRHRLDYGGNRRIDSVLYIASVTNNDSTSTPALTSTQAVGGQDPPRRNQSTQTTPRPAESSDASGTTNHDDTKNTHDPPVDKGASDVANRLPGCGTKCTFPDGPGRSPGLFPHLWMVAGGAGSAS